MSLTNDLKIPTKSDERMVALDALRGFAVLGILIMNIQSFSMISAAYLNPTAYGGLTGLNKWVWIFSHIFGDLKFLTIFSLLFGAGIVLFTSRLQSKGLPAVAMHYRRTFWLLLIGFAHAYLLWYGDILVPYALCGFLVVLLRKLSAKIQLSLGLIIFAIPSLLYIFFGLTWDFMPPEAHQDIGKSWYSTGQLIEEELTAYRSGWWDQMSVRIPAAINLQTSVFLIYMGWRVAGLMLIGMALYKWGFLTAQKSKSFYLTITFTLGLAGILIVVYGVQKNFAADWVVEYSMFLGSLFNYWGSLLISAAYISIIMLISLSSRFTRITKIFAAVGRMAFSNYLFQTLICTLIFYGHGLGLFGYIERTSQILIVFVVWIIQLLISPIWLHYFRFGPIEWTWRSLTYWKIQPIRNLD
jgi:uncharacterized protein